MNTALLYMPCMPNIVWCNQFVSYREIWIEQQENFPKSSFRNRYEIAGANGRLKLTIPILGGRDHHQRYIETKIDYKMNWQKTHWQSIQSAYGNTPFWDHYKEKLIPFFETKTELLFDFNHALLLTILDLIKVSKTFHLTSCYETSPDKKSDFRSSKTMEPLAIDLPRYYQPFETKNGFVSNLSIIDVIFNLGPDTKSYLQSR